MSVGAFHPADRAFPPETWSAKPRAQIFDNRNLITHPFWLRFFNLISVRCWWLRYAKSQRIALDVTEIRFGFFRKYAQAHPIHNGGTIFSSAGVRRARLIDDSFFQIHHWSTALASLRKAIRRNVCGARMSHGPFWLRFFTLVSLHCWWLRCAKSHSVQRRAQPIGSNPRFLAECPFAFVFSPPDSRLASKRNPPSRRTQTTPHAPDLCRQPKRRWARTTVTKLAFPVKTFPSLTI